MHCAVCTSPTGGRGFENEGGARDGGPDDPRLALISVEPTFAMYLKSTHSRPRVLFEIAKGIVTGSTPELGREETLHRGELESR